MWKGWENPRALGNRVEKNSPYGLLLNLEVYGKFGV